MVQIITNTLMRSYVLSGHGFTASSLVKVAQWKLQRADGHPEPQVLPPGGVRRVRTGQPDHDFQRVAAVTLVAQPGKGLDGLADGGPPDAQGVLRTCARVSVLTDRDSEVYESWSWNWSWSWSWSRHRSPRKGRRRPGWAGTPRRGQVQATKK